MTPTIERIVKELRDEAAKLNNVADILSAEVAENQPHHLLARGSYAPLVAGDPSLGKWHSGKATTTNNGKRAYHRKHWTQRPENKAKVLSIMRKAQKARAA